MTAGCGWESCEPSMGTGTAKAEKGLTPAKSFGWRVWRPNGKVGCCWESFARGCCRLERNFWAQSAETAAPEGPKAPKGKIRTPIQPRAESNLGRGFRAGPYLGWRRGGLSVATARASPAGSRHPDGQPLDVENSRALWGFDRRYPARGPPPDLTVTAGCAGWWILPWIWWWPSPVAVNLALNDPPRAWWKSGTWLDEGAGYRFDPVNRRIGPSPGVAGRKSSWRRCGVNGRSKRTGFEWSGPALVSIGGTCERVGPGWPDRERLGFGHASGWRLAPRRPAGNAHSEFVLGRNVGRRPGWCHCDGGHCDSCCRY